MPAQFETNTAAMVGNMQALMWHMHSSECQRQSTTKIFDACAQNNCPPMETEHKHGLLALVAECQAVIARLMILASLIARTHKHGDEELKRDVDLQRPGVFAQQRRRPRTYTMLAALTARHPAFNVDGTQARLPSVNARHEGCHAPKRYTSKAATAAPASAAFSSKKVTPGHGPLSGRPRKLLSYCTHCCSQQERERRPSLK